MGPTNTTDAAKLTYSREISEFRNAFYVLSGCKASGTVKNILRIECPPVERSPDVTMIDTGGLLKEVRLGTILFDS